MRSHRHRPAPPLTPEQRAVALSRPAPKPVADADCLPLSEKDIVRARAAGLVRRRQGRPTLGTAPRQTVTLRLDPEVLSWFRQGGAGYQSRINRALRWVMEHPTTIR